MNLCRTLPSLKLVSGAPGILSAADNRAALLADFSSLLHKLQCCADLKFYSFHIMTYCGHSASKENLKQTRVGVFCARLVQLVLKTSDCQPEGPGVQSPAWSRIELWTTFLNHIIRGQGG